MRTRRLLGVATAIGMTAWTAVAAAPHAFADQGGVANDHASVPAAVHGMGSATIGDVNAAKGVGPGSGGGKSNNLAYRGGAIAHAPVVFLVFWGSQWGTQASRNDPSGEATYLQAFLGGVGAAERWSRSTTQYCSGVATGTTNCATALGSKVFVGQPAAALLASNVWYDDTSAAPSSPTQSQLAAEAVKAAGHFSQSASADIQFVIATAHNNNASGFGTQYCAWHSSTGYQNGSIAYTNLPYITDAGGSCGANFVGGPLDGISIVEGHEYAETVTDPFPNGGWLDNRGAENGDKCAWIQPGLVGGSFPLTLGTGTFAVQTLWSNAANGGNGGCVGSF